MPATKPLYDLVLMLDTSADDGRRNEIVASAEEMISSGGELVTKQDWGPRQMAFEIRHKKDADYHLLQFHATPELLERLDRQLRIVDEVVRYRIVKLAPGTPPPVEQRSEPRPAGSTVETDAVETPAPENADERQPRRQQPPTRPQPTLLQLRRKQPQTRPPTSHPQRPTRPTSRLPHRPPSSARYSSYRALDACPDRGAAPADSAQSTQTAPFFARCRRVLRTPV